MLSIIIPTYNRNDELKNLLSSLEKNSFFKNELIVLTPNIEPEIQNICEKYKAGLFNDGSRKNGKRIKSLWGIINSGIEMAKNNFVVWLNDDCLVEKDWDKIACEAMGNNQDLGIFCAKGIGDSQEFRIIRSLDTIPCANYGVLRKTSGFRFDERFGWFYGDADLPVVINSRGGKIVEIENHLIIHNHIKDENRIANETDPKVLQDKFKFERKWKNWEIRNGRIRRKKFLKISIEIIIDFCRKIKRKSKKNLG